MKASVKLRKEEAGHENPLLRFKLPIQILGLPFISSFTAGDSKDLSFNLHTNFLNGPSIKLSYTPTQTTTSAIHTHHQPISLSLKSGVGLFGSPKNSPLIISAHFTHFPNPTFSLHIKPQFGDFSLSKTAVSCTSPFNSGVECNDVESVERPVVVMRNLCSGYEDGVFSGVGVKAQTVLPVGKNAVEVKFRWGVNFPEESFDKMRLKLPFLTVDKISIERVEKEREVVVEKKKKKSGVGDGEMLKGMCFWMKKEVEVLQRENNLIKEGLEEMKMNGSLRRSYSRGSSNNDVSRPLGENSSEFEKRKSKKNGAEEKGRNGVKSKKFSGSDTSSGNDVEEELKRAIMAASSSGV